MDNENINTNDTNTTSEVKEETKPVDEGVKESDTSQTSTEEKKDTAEEVKIETFKFEGSPLNESRGTSNKQKNKPKAARKKKNVIVDWLGNIAKSKKKIKTIAIGAVVVVVVGGLIIANRNRLVELSDSQVVIGETYEVNSKADFYNVDDTVFYSTKDGMKINNTKTKTENTDTFTMTSPMMKCEGEYVAVAEKKGKQVRVYNKDGNLHNIVTDGEIITFTVNPNGYTAVCYTNKKEDTYTIDVYNPSCVQISHTKSTTDNGIPVSIDISDDGRVLAISFFNTSGLNMKSNLLFYYTNNKDAALVDDSDGMFSSFIFDNEVLGEIHFLTNDDLIAISDSRVICYKYGTSYKERWSHEFTNQITAVAYPANSSVICAYGDKISSKADAESYDANTVVWYNSNNGNEQFETVTDKKITALYAKSDAVIVGMNRYFEAYTSGGSKLWSYTSTQDVSKMQFYKDSDRVMIVTPTKMSVVNIKKGTNTSDDVDAVKSESEKTQAAEESTTQAQTAEQTTAAAQ